VALRAAGLIAGGRLGIDLLHEAVDVLATSGARLDRARALCDLGAALRRGNRRRVAELAAAGRANREIAQELVVTVRTVEFHLSRAYAKLGVRTRAALPDALHEQRA